MPVREISNRGGQIIGHFPSVTMGRMIGYESLIERDYLYLIDQDRRVTWFEEQPLTIAYVHEGKTRHYTPDVLQHEDARRVLVECKPASLTDTEENQRKFAAAREWCAARGYTFRVVTEREIRRPYRLANVKLVTQFARHTVSPDVRGRVFAVLADGPMSISGVAAGLCPEEPQRLIVDMLHLIYHHEIAAPLEDAPLRGDTMVQLPLHAPPGEVTR